MDTTTSLHLLQTMIDFFESGNQETDAAAKSIIESDFEYSANWEAELQRLRQGPDWTGLRSPEAEIVGAALRHIQELLAAQGT